MGDHEEHPVVPIAPMAPLVPKAVLYDWAQPAAENLATSILVPQIQGESFQITNNMLHLLQNTGLFSGSQVKDPQQHLKIFRSICKSQRQPNITPEAIKLLLFPFSVIGAAQTCQAIREQVPPPNKTAQQIDDILSFKQRPMESLHETWESFKGMLVICPHHGIPNLMSAPWHSNLMLGQRFYIRLSDNVKNIVDASAGGAFLSKTWREGQGLLDKMIQNSGWITKNAPITPVVHSVPLDPSNSMAENMATLLSQMSILTKRVQESGQKQQVHIVDTTNGGLSTSCISQPIGNQWPTGHDHQHYPEDMNYMSNYGGQRQGGQNWGQQNQQYRPAQSQFNSGNMGELDESMKLTEVTAQPAQEEGNIQIETEKEAEIVQKPVVDVAADKYQSQIIGKKRPSAPFPQRLAKYQKEEQYKKFLEMLKQI
uniref:Uncharacterized protein n=2 Tax=Nicotiana TaxID=4085 RepID=A0A1S3ZFH9_TOBAC|nr:PREDICTED: uncharacterized protein LOC104237906 [Nicotiana sylvestris]XP_016463198.1 PREDICTED: uncharacterized protein LOC107786264 [Nicotiana tabacum]